MKIVNWKSKRKFVWLNAHHLEIDVRLVWQTGKRGLNFSSQVMKLPVLSAFTLTKKAKLHRGVTLNEFFGPTKRTPNILPKLFTDTVSHFLWSATELHTVRAPIPTSWEDPFSSGRALCITLAIWQCRGLSDLLHSPSFVKLNALEVFGGGAFTFSIFILIFFAEIHFEVLIKWQNGYIIVIVLYNNFEY